MSLKNHILSLNIQLNPKTIDKDQISDVWAALNKCKRFIENGQRLEYMSWRLWQQKTLHHSTSSPAITHDAFCHEVSQHDGPIKTQDDDQVNKIEQETIINNNKRIIIIDEDEDEDEDEDYFYSDEEEEEIQYEFIKMKPRPPTSQRSLLSDLLQRESNNSSPPSLSNSSTSSSHSFDTLHSNNNNNNNNTPAYNHHLHLISTKDQDIHWKDEPFHDCW
ncbi:hypothetical protein BCV72DRAFT_304985 [Rhizopus microsporus var. microsporus]|uniref:Nitrogen regulatory protein areA GATA-like domain-containing protein n=1 Tax=Rhizopus microsporus var. microsporus TaxID=86635 RepID=A0A1X0R4U9_RHIZD|nr:hypothetical protein BCV72DRAFT_304985 [Rhizopus microsporus var. microsporus]